MSGEGGPELAAGGLGQIAQGLTLALAELKELGMTGEAGAGRGFSDIALSGLELGHQGLTDTFASFCERWEWGVRSLVGEGNAFAVKTGLSAGTYYETDQYVQGSFKVAVNAGMGNPYASEEEITGKDWGEVLSSNPVSHAMNADYSKESFEKALADSGQGWKDAGRDVMTSDVSPVMTGLRQADGMSDAEYEQKLDQVFGPSPEARAEAAGLPQGGGEG